jgi:hypothetical protein
MGRVMRTVLLAVICLGILLLAAAVVIAVVVTNRRRQ